MKMSMKKPMMSKKMDNKKPMMSKKMDEKKSSKKMSYTDMKMKMMKKRGMM
jgi:hypothetical protein